MPTKKRIRAKRKRSAKYRSIQRDELRETAVHQKQSSDVVQQAQIDPGSLTPHDVVHLQRTIGNRATGQLLSVPNQTLQLKGDETHRVAVAYALGAKLSHDEITTLMDTVGAEKLRYQIGTNMVLNYLDFVNVDELAEILSTRTTPQLYQLQQRYLNYGDDAFRKYIKSLLIQPDVDVLQQDLLATKDPTLKKILGEVLEMEKLLNVVVGYGKSDQMSHVSVKGKHEVDRRYRVVIDEKQIPEQHKRLSILLHELMHVSADQEYKINKKLGDDMQNLVYDPKDPENSAKEQIQFLRQLVGELREVVSSEKEILGKSIAEYMLKRLERAEAVPNQEFDTIISELYYYLSKQKGAGRTKTFKKLQSMAKGAYEARERQVPLISVYIPPGSFKEFATESACFITTACVKARGLPDDCEELTVLRAFRDGYMWQLPDGPHMVREYYRIAPGIVAAIDAQADAAAVYDRLYTVIGRCVQLIHQGKNERALTTYKNMVLQLQEAYKPALTELVMA